MFQEFMFDEPSLTSLKDFFPADNFKVDNLPGGLRVLAKGKLCSNIEKKNIKETVELKLGVLAKCGESSGSEVLKKIIDFAGQNGYSIISLDNAASIKVPCGEKEFRLDLTYVKLLEIGNTWYSQFGFESETSKELEGQIKKIIDNTFANLLEKLNDVNENKNKENRDMMKRYKTELNFSYETVISEFIKEIMQQIKKNELCDKLNNLKKFIEFLGNSLSTIVTHGKTTEVDELIRNNFTHLKLDLKKSGGKIKKAKTIKRRKMKAKAKANTKKGKKI